MRGWKKLILPVTIFLGFFALTSCQSAPANDTSVIEQAAQKTNDASCEALYPPTIDADRFDSLGDVESADLGDYWRDWVLEVIAAHEEWCS